MDHTHDAVEQRIARQVRRMLDLPDTLADRELARADLFDLGLTSKSALGLTAWLETEFGLVISLRDVFADPYVETLAELVAERVANAPAPEIADAAPAINSVGSEVA
ncbi:acyl carrier protein [Kitasatospora sp. NPDC098652]|uniref:acyl carrier protein n=1 Tax=Kitasatospora sp. NPDC098652 TaxID=3364095 RepID=UPI00381920BB